MTRYLLDRDVLSQLDQPEASRHRNVRAWLASVPDEALHVSAVTVMEAWKGLTISRRRASGDLEKLRENDRYESAFGRLLSAFSDKIVPIDEPIAKLWGQLLGHQDKHMLDTCVAATAATNDMVVVTRNVDDFKRRGVRVLDPFRKNPRISETDVL